MNKIPVLFAIIIILATCSKEEVTPRNYPRVNTLEVTDITSGGATFTGEIIFTSVPVLDHGFLWSEFGSALFENSDQISLGTKSGTGSFEAKCDRSLQEGKTYYVRGYAKSEDNIVYGDVVKFVSLGSKAPVINDFYPATASWGDTVTLVGENFSTVISTNFVKFNAISSRIITASKDTLRVQVPFELNAELSSITLTRVGNVSTLPKQFQLKAPILESVSPASATVGSRIIITGKFIKSAGTKVYFNDVEATFYQWGLNSIEYTVPAGLTAGAVVIKVVTGSGNLFDTLPFVVQGPLLTQVSPATAYIGDKIKLIGNFFAPGIESNTVMFDNYLTTILSVSTTEMEVIVPFTDRINPKITVTSYGSTASIETFSLQAPEVTGFSPQRGTFNTEIIITGNHFLLGSFHKVFLDDIELSNVYAPLETEIHAFIPWDLSKHSGEIKITFYDQEIVSPGQYESPWIRIADFPGDYLNSSVSMIYNNKAYVGLGGGPELSNQFWRLDPNSNQWNRLNDFPGTERYNSFYFVVGSKGYVGGGWGTSEKATDVWEYSFATDSWVTKSDIPWNGNVSMGFALGNEGFVVEQDFDAGVSKVWKYNTGTDTWSMMSTAPFIIDSNSKYFVIGNSYYVTDDSGYGTSFWKYTSTTNQWTSLGLTPNRIDYATSLGGFGYVGTYGQFYKYDPTLNSWTIELDGYFNHRPSEIFSVNGKAYFIGGYNYEYNNTSYEFDPSY